MYKSLFTDNVVICPYNESHRIARSRIQKHIVKCEKNYPSDYKMMCPYNATHRLFKHEMAKHIITCSTRQLIEPELYQRSGNLALRKNKLHATVSSLDCCESWDDEFRCDFTPPTLKDVPPAMNNKVTKMNYGDIRAPRGFSEAMLVEADTEPIVEDLQSVTSAMGMGRGKLILGKTDVLPTIVSGQGSYRKKPLKTDKTQT